MPRDVCSAYSSRPSSRMGSMSASAGLPSPTRTRSLMPSKMPASRLPTRPRRTRSSPSSPTPRQSVSAKWRLQASGRSQTSITRSCTSRQAGPRKTRMPRRSCACLDRASSHSSTAPREASGPCSLSYPKMLLKKFTMLSHHEGLACVLSVLDAASEAVSEEADVSSVSLA